MAQDLTKRELEHLAELARIKLMPAEEEKLLNDLKKILDHVAELTSVNTEMVPPMTGGTDLQNVFRADDARANTNRGAGTDAFPENKDGFLKIPPVFGETEPNR